jgi:uncharacterized OsmC-like protein
VSAGETRRYAVSARSTDTFGRVLWKCREHHFVADGPVHNGAPGEAVTPAELFLAGIATCGVELVAAIAHAEGVPLISIGAEISGEIDPNDPVRDDVNVFNRVRVSFRLGGVTEEQGGLLVDRFKKR